MEHCCARCADLWGLAGMLGDKAELSRAHCQSCFSYSGADIEFYFVVFFQVRSLSGEQKGSLTVELTHAQITPARCSCPMLFFSIVPAKDQKKKCGRLQHVLTGSAFDQISYQCYNF